MAKKGIAVGFILVLGVLSFCFFAKRQVPAPIVDETDTKIEETVKPDIKSVNSADIKKADSYTLILKDGTLSFYLSSDGDVILLDSYPMEESLYPSADISELRAGITVSELRDGIGIVEDFTS